MDFHDDEATMKELEQELEQAEKLMGSVKAQAGTDQQKHNAGQCHANVRLPVSGLLNKLQCVFEGLIYLDNGTGVRAGREVGGQL